MPRTLLPSSALGQRAQSAQTGNFSAGTTVDQTLYIVTPSAAAAACTLPPGDSVPNGFRVAVKNNTDGRDVTVVHTGDDTIDGATSYRVPGRSLVEFESVDDDTWIVVRTPPHPVGAVIEWTKDSLPAGGWAWCNGVALSRTTCQGLFSEIGTTYGAGDGSTTFNPPDRRGRVAAGKDDMGGASAANRLTSGGSGITGTTLGASGGAQTHTLTTAEMPAHTHAQTTWLNNSGSASYFAFGGSDGNNPGPSGMPPTGSTGGGGPHNNMQPTLISNFIVKT